MSYTLPTAANLKARFPEFSAVSDAIVTEAIREASGMVDKTWLESDYRIAIMLAACHIMALEGLGTGPDSKSNSGSAANFQTIRSGQLTLTRGNTVAYGDGSWWGSTRYGRRFWYYLRRNKAGPRVVAGDTGAQSGYAKDVPWSPPWGYR